MWHANNVGSGRIRIHNTDLITIPFWYSAKYLSRDGIQGEDVEEENVGDLAADAAPLEIRVDSPEKISTSGHVCSLKKN